MQREGCRDAHSRKDVAAREPLTRLLIPGETRWVVTRDADSRRTWYWSSRPLHVWMRLEDMSDDRSDSTLKSEMVDPPAPPYADWLTDMSAWNDPPGTPSVRVESRRDIVTSHR